MYSTVGSYKTKQGQYLISARTYASAVRKGEMAIHKNPKVAIDTDDLSEVTDHWSWSPEFQRFVAKIENNPKLPKGVIVIATGVYFIPPRKKLRVRGAPKTN